MRHAIRRSLGGLVLAAAALFAAPPVHAKPFDQLVPENSSLFVSFRNTADLCKRWEASPFGEAWKSPEMEPFAGKIADAFEILFTEAGKELGYSPKDYKELLQGELAVVVGDPAKVDFQADEIEFPFALLLDVGAHKDKAKEFIQKNLDLADQKGHAARREEEFRGQRMVLLSEKEPKKKHLKAVALTLADDLLAVSFSQPFLQDILANRAEAAVKPLSEHADYKALRGKYGKDADVFIYAHVGRWLDQIPRLVKASGEDGADEKVETATKVLDLLGVSAVRAVCGASTVGADAVVDSWFVLAPGKPRGILKALWTQPQPLKFPAVIPEDASSCSVLQADFEAVWTMVEDIAKMSAEAMTKAAGGTPDSAINPLQSFQDGLGIDLRKDLVASLGRQVILFNRLQKPYSAQSERMAFLVELKDKATFQATLDKLQPMMGLKKKEYLGRSVYSFGGRRMTPDEPDGGDEKADEGPPMPAVAVTDTHFVFASSKALCEEIIRRAGKEVKSVNDAAGFKAVAGRLPASAIVINYQSTEAFDYLFYALKELGKGEGSGLGMMLRRSLERADDAEGEDRGREFMKKLIEACEALPEASVITRRLEGVIGWGFTEENGIGFISHLVFKKAK